MKRRAFTLIEMLVATVLSAVLMSAVLSLIAGASRDRRTLTALNAQRPAPGIATLVAWDLSNAASISRAEPDQSIVLIGNCGIDPAGLTPNGRLVQVNYRLQSATKNLWRNQQYLDDPARPVAWQQLMAADVSSFDIDPNTGDESPIARRMRLRVTTAQGVIDQTLWIK